MTLPVPAEAQAVPASPFSLVPTGLAIQGQPTFDEWRAFGQTLRGISTAVRFAIGDWLRYGEHAYGEKYAQAAADLDYDPATLRNFAYVSGNVHPSRRRDNLPYTKQAVVAPLAPEQQEKVLSQAASMSRGEVRELVNKLQGNPVTRRESFAAEIAPDGTVSVEQLAYIRGLLGKPDFSAELVVKYTEPGKENPDSDLRD